MRAVLPPTALAAAALLALVGCAPTGSDAAPIDPSIDAVGRDLATDPDVEVLADLEYGAVDGTPLLLDACLPPDRDPSAAAVPGIVVVHGGSWREGRKDSVGWRAVCTWLRAPEQAARFGVDPDRIGVFGGSAGGNLAALLGTTGRGALTQGSRVAAVAELSGPIDLTGVAITDDFIPIQLEYLGCGSFATCPVARAASPGTHVDATDPPFLVAHSTAEKIPIAQSDRFVERLRAAGVDVEYYVAAGTLHSIALLDDDLKSRILGFYERTLGPPAPRLVPDAAR